MAKVTVHDTPSGAIVKAAHAEEFVTDSRGRTIGVRKLKVLERIGMLKLIGQGNNDNLLYVSSVSPAFLVTSIDGDPVIKPATDRQLDALLLRLDEEGLEAVTNWMAAQGEPRTEADELKNS